MLVQEARAPIDKMWVRRKLSGSPYNTFTHTYGKELRIRGGWHIARLLTEVYNGSVSYKSPCIHQLMMWP